MVELRFKEKMMLHLNMIEYKIVLIGPSNSGKTTYLYRFLTGQFEKDYVPTIGCEVHPITFKTSDGTIRLNCWDTAGDDKFIALISSYSTEADGAIIFRDACSVSEPSKVEIASDIARSDAKKVYVTNKCDNEKLTVSMVPLPFYQISANQTITTRNHFFHCFDRLLEILTWFLLSNR